MRKLFALLILTVCILPAQRRGRRPPCAEFRFRFVGPQAGNRMSAIAGIPGDASTRITRARRPAASGNPSTAATDWTPIFDDQPVPAIGALAVAPSDPNMVWAGTGEAWAIRDCRRHGQRNL